MARTGRPKALLVLSDDERAQLVRWSRRRKSSQALALRSRIVLAPLWCHLLRMPSTRQSAALPRVGEGPPTRPPKECRRTDREGNDPGEQGLSQLNVFSDQRRWR